MTEIPEHLLKRAAERRAAMTGGAAPSDDAPAAAAPAAGGDAAPAAAVEPKAKATAPLPTLADDAPKARPDLPVVVAAKNRKRIPFWAAPVLALLPLWAMLYVYSVQPPPASETDPLVIGKEVYEKTGGCQGCHQADGSGVKSGGTGQQLSEGHVLATFPDPLDMAHWIAYGSEGGARADGSYGNPDAEGGERNINDIGGNMPAFAKSLSPEEIAAVIIYVREELSGGDPADDPNFDVETYTADPEALAAMVQEVIDLGAGGDPKTADVEGSESGASAE